jgi:hypothetical protein
MYCSKCGSVTVNGERQCKICGADLNRPGGPALMTERPQLAEDRRPLSRLAAWFFGLTSIGLFCLIASAVIAAVLSRAPSGTTLALWNLGLVGLGVMAVGFILLCSALLFGLLGALRLRQDRHLRGRGLMAAGAILWLVGAAIFLVLRTNSHYRPPVVPLRAPAGGGLTAGQH